MVPAVGGAASLFDPALRFRTLATDHFIIYFDERHAHLAPQLAAIAEEAWSTVPPILGIRPPARTHVVLADQADAANGWAYPLPYNTIVVTAAWPRGTDFIGNTDDWLRLVFVHEFTHIVHLDHARGWSRVVRSMFGRTPFSFPNLFLPAWQVEGLATMVESLTAPPAGRLFSDHFRELELVAARRGRLQPLDRVNGGLTAWPAGQAAYAYGAGFYDFLAGNLGGDRVAMLVSRTAGRLPYLSSRVFEQVFGESLGDLWTAYQRSLAIRIPRFPDEAARATRLTRHGYYTSGPRYVEAACDLCPPRIVYSARTPHDFPALRLVDADGSNPRDLATRYLGETAGTNRNLIVFDQLERHRNVGEYSDLYSMNLQTGDVQRLTREARLKDPDISPDGMRIAAVRERGGVRELVLLSLNPTETRTHADTLSVLLSADNAQFDSPRWSPDGRLIAVTRQRLDSARADDIPRADLVIVDSVSRRILAVAADNSLRFGQAAWRPDGTGVVVAASDGLASFQLYDLDIPRGTSPEQMETLGRPLTAEPGGATWPDVSPDGGRIVFVGRTTEGFDLFTMPYLRTGEPGAFVPTTPPTAIAIRWTDGSSPPSIQTEPSASANAFTAYRPWRTLIPSAWSPIVEDAGRTVRVGATTGGSDVLGYHAYAASVAWLTARPSEAAPPAGGGPDWFAAYAYGRWRPTFLFSASRRTSFLTAFPESGSPETLTESWQDRDLEAGVAMPFERVRVRHRALATMLYSRSDVASAVGSRVLERTAIRTGWSTVSARTYGYSISREDGVAVGGTAEWAFGDRGAATTITADARIYAPGLRQHHVVAFRAGGGVSHGPRELRRTFYLGGAAPATDAIDFSRDAFSLLRGFSADSFGGSRVVLVNGEYRWPLARPERGVGTWPAFLHSIHASLFGDLGHAWTARPRIADAKLALGAELSFDLVVGYSLPLTIAGGAAWGRDGARPRGDPAARGASAYLRLGAGF
jgi:dipeptidyl aminopeptidase/acylaminoacyl peptidase